VGGEFQFQGFHVCVKKFFFCLKCLNAKNCKRETKTLWNLFDLCSCSQRNTFADSMVGGGLAPPSLSLSRRGRPG